MDSVTQNNCLTRNSVVAGKQRDAFVENAMMWLTKPALWRSALEKLIPHFRPFKVTQGHWNRHESTRHLWFPISVVTLSLKHTVFEIFDFKNAVTLKTGLRVCQLFGNATIWQRAYDFLLTFYSNYGSTSCRFWHIQCRKMLWPWNPGERSLKFIESEVVPFSRLFMVPISVLIAIVPLSVDAPFLRYSTSKMLWPSKPD